MVRKSGALCTYMLICIKLVDSWDDYIFLSGRVKDTILKKKNNLNSNFHVIKSQNDYLISGIY